MIFNLWHLCNEEQNISSRGQFINQTLNLANELTINEDVVMEKCGRDKFPSLLNGIQMNVIEMSTLMRNYLDVVSCDIEKRQREIYALFL